MEPIKNRTFLIQLLLIGLSTTLAILAFTMAEKSLTFNTNSWGYFNDDTGNKHPIVLGVITFNFLAIYMSYIACYLIFEFYGFKAAFYNVLNVVLMTVLCFIIFQFMILNVLDENLVFDHHLMQILDHSRLEVTAWIMAILLGYTTAFVSAAIIKKMSRNYFMFIRFPIASALGFTVFVGTSLYITKFQVLAPRSMLTLAITPLAQFAILITVSVVPLYLLRLLFGMFRGSQPKDLDSKDAKSNSQNTLFKGAESEDIPAAPPPQETEKNTKQNNLEDVQEEEKETTVSKKVHLEEPKTQH